MKKCLFSLLVILTHTLIGLSQGKDSVYVIKDEKVLAHTSIKDQYKSGTCWSFSGLSFVESEILRVGKGEYNLSEAFIIRFAYLEKAIRYVRFQGKVNFGAGGAFHDVIFIIKKYGIVPEEIYPGLNYGTDKFDHRELDEVLKAYVEAIVKNPGQQLSTAWINGFNGILDAYFGKVPQEFEYKGKKYTPQSFAASLGLNWDDYVEITSFTHHPYYTSFVFELPDNWLHDIVYNVSLNDLATIIDNALQKGYTVAWASDVSEKSFSWKNGLAILPDEKREDLTGSERERWEKLSEEEKRKQLYSFETYIPEMKPSVELRQKWFDNYQTTDDHGMHIVGIAKDERGNVYYKVKNSWAETGKYKGYLYASRTFVLMKTTDIMVHKDVIPTDIRKKLKL
ncbi:MAG: aminopeptidase [Bacteroidales bacterium]|nr:aminopeptidase [Bacteroidales bacterium]